MEYRRFHIFVKKGRGTRRTTLSLEPYLADLMAIKLGEDPGTLEAHAAVRAWIQREQDEQNASYPCTNIIKEHLVLQIADKNLAKKYFKKIE